MNIIFMGTPTIALATLDTLAAKHNVAAVYTRPDAAWHRGSQKRPSLVKAHALQLGIDCHTPQSFFVGSDAASGFSAEGGNRVVDAEVLADIKDCDPDIIVVYAYGLRLPDEILAVPRYGCINIHASLLPRWRGSAPIQWAILTGDEQTGVSIMRMESSMDTGPYCLQAATLALHKSYSELIVELGQMSAELLVPNLEAIAAGKLEWTQQDESLVTYANKIPKGSVDLDPELTVEENYRRVLASSRHARSRTTLFGRPVLVYEAYPAEEQSDKRVYYECSDGLLEITILKPAGKREMTGAAFLAGLR